MKTRVMAVAIALLAAACMLAQESQPQPAIDWQRAQQLRRKEQQGETLTPEDKAYLDRAKAEVAAGRGPGRAAANTNRTDRSSAKPPPAQEKLGLLPLDQMSASDRYKGQDGGLYGGGRNQPPAEHLQIAQKALAKIQPLDAEGRPAPNGKIVLLTLGMSNTMGESAHFVRVSDADRARNPSVVVVNGAIGGMTADQWAKPDSQVWPTVRDSRLKAAGVTENQVQVLWLKHAIAGPARFGDFPASAEQLKTWLIGDVQQLLPHFPQARVVYLSSRIYAGNAVSSLNPEPYAYESAFAVRWVIQEQIQGNPELNCDPAQGKVKAPVLLWGPYLWADGVTPRKSDGLSYLPADFQRDGTHPAPGATEKVAHLLSSFFHNDLNAAWYLKDRKKEP